MANNVFANDLEIACKAADGKSVAAFPDPCFSPPDPTKVVIPYANTAYAKDTANASKTVFISGKPVMKKDISYFKTSTGDEAAAGLKGVTTGVKQGKAYFTSWSMNVKVEGQNVDRHTDGMTHNHGSKVGNTGIWKYVDSQNGGDCQDEIRRVEIACGGMKKGNVPNPRGNSVRKDWVPKSGPVNWKGKHCKFLSFKPTSSGLKGAEKSKAKDPLGVTKPENLLEELKTNLTEIDAVGRVMEEARDKAMGVVVSQLAKLGAKAVVSKFVPIAGWIYSAYEAVDDIADASYYLDMYDGAVIEGNRMLNQVTGIKNEIEETIAAVKKGDFSEVQSKLADWQRSAATLDPCIRARKCMLVPFNDTFANPENARTPRNSGGNNQNRGCCPGQTGHHLIPDAWIKNSGCRGYNYDTAPAVCAEGQNQFDGSHGAIHTHTTEMVVPDTDWVSEKPSTASYADVRDGAVHAHAKTFPLSTCSRKCIKSQLDDEYEKMQCGDLTVSSKGMGSKPGGTTTTSR